MQYNHLLSPFYIGKVRVKNRMVMAPMNAGGLVDTDGSLSDKGMDYLVERAKGGVGLITTGATRTTRKFERDSSTIPLWMLYADNKVHTRWMNELAEKCHDYGAKVAIQLTAGVGRAQGRYAQENNLAIGPSEIPCLNPPYLPTRSLTVKEIDDIFSSFCLTASFVKNSGIDIIALHGHEGFLMDMFTTSLWNKRTDSYGGSLKNRMRFVEGIINSVREGAGSDMPIIYRYGLTHGIDGGRTEDEGLEMALLLQEMGVNALDIDAGCFETPYLPHPPATVECGCLAKYAEKVKRVVNIPVITSSRIGYAEVAEQILADGKADFVSMGRPLLADPFIIEKISTGHSEDVRPCIACHEGCQKRLIDFKSISCAVNPCTGNERYLELTEAKKKKKAIVIGGGISGIVAAITLAERGHDVTLYEKEKELGGNLRECYLPSFKEDEKKYLKYLKHQLQKTSVRVILNHEFTNSDFYGDEDIFINASGGILNSITIKGLDKSLIIDTCDCYLPNTGLTCQKVVIVGGGMVGVEAALNLSRQGASVTIIERKDKIANSAFKANRQHLFILLNENKVKMLTNTSVTEAVNGNLVCIRGSQKFEVPFDKVAICVGVKTREISLDLPSKCMGLTLGDAEKPGRIINAVWNAYRKCRLL